MIRAYCINLISTALFCLLGYSHGKAEPFPGLFGKGLPNEKHLLMNKIHEDGGAALCVVTAEEWLDAVKENRSLPPEQRRYFISDCIEEGDTIDRMIIEVPYSEYRRWNSRHTVSERSRRAKKEFLHLSLDAAVPGSPTLALSDCLADSGSMETAVLDAVLIDELKIRLTAWKPWAAELLAHYLAGRKKSCTAVMAEKYGVSEQVIRKYKRQFEAFVKKFLAGVSF